MSDVRIKKSVLQSIIKKSLRESPRMDVERRITVGPDNSRLPSMLPLSPSDRMSTQLEIERPPVEDPEYSPSNPKELGFAVQALAEMVHPEQVEEVYTSFKQIIEKLEEEESDDKATQIESMIRKHKAFNKLMREAEGSEDDDDYEMSSEEKAELDAIERREASGPDAMFFKYERVLRAYGLGRNHFDNIIRATRGGRVSAGDIEDFLELLGSLQSDPAIVEKVGDRLRSPNERGLVSFISKFKDDYEEQVAREEATKADAARPKFEYQTAAKPYGYAAASGLRQAFIRDVLGVRALSGFVAPKEVQRFVYNSIREAFEDAFDLPENQDFLKTLFDEEGLEEYKSIMKDPGALVHSTLFQNFAGAVSYEALASIADLNFKTTRRGPGRKIGLAFMTEFGDENKKLQSFEEDQLEQMAMRGEYADFVGEILDTSEENGHRGLLTAAAAMTADDADKDEYGSYASPAFSTMKKAASVSKPPELHVADYMGKDDPMVGQIKTADRAAAKASKMASKSNKTRRT
jgi:hypothetical protein